VFASRNFWLVQKNSWMQKHWYHIIQYVQNVKFAYVSAPTGVIGYHRPQWRDCPVFQMLCYRVFCFYCVYTHGKAFYVYRRSILFKKRKQEEQIVMKILNFLNMLCILFHSKYSRTRLLTTSVYTTPRLYRQVFCGTNHFLTANHNVTLLGYNDTRL
jgi:hypothetical protein